MLRVTVIDSSEFAVRLRVEGRLTGQSVGELRQACELHAPGNGSGLTLDVADVSFADAEGIELLKRLESRNVAIVNLTPFLALRLRGRSDGN